MRISASATKRLLTFRPHWCSIQTTTCCADISSIWVVKSPKAVQLPSGLCSANDITHEQRIAGCTASIESGTLTGWPLKVAYCNRGYALTGLGEYDRVITDSDALIAINPQAGQGFENDHIGRQTSTHRP